mmetsp:Transcript_22139/g.22454  ORF Transcript_22139/g.22454 Transcript_22139/m.22454 type:complete len:84 (-) Transcript_22139:434-685(-)
MIQPQATIRHLDRKWRANDLLGPCSEWSFARFQNRKSLIELHPWIAIAIAIVFAVAVTIAGDIAVDLAVAITLLLLLLLPLLL